MGFDYGRGLKHCPFHDIYYYGDVCPRCKKEE